MLVDRSKIVPPAAPASPGPSNDDLARKLFGKNRRELIAATAYGRAVLRCFRDGTPDDDWYAAEREIDALLAASRRGSR